MNVSVSLFAYLLSASQVWGGVATLLLFVVCFVAVHAVKLSTKGYTLYKKERQDTPAPKEEKTAAEPARTEKQSARREMPAPVYYLVEKKRVRKKAPEYAEPQRIRFDEEESRRR